MAESQELKKELVFDLHFVHGPREVVALTKTGLEFIRKNYVGLSLRTFYMSAIEEGLHCSFEDTDLRDEIAKSVPAIQ